MESIWQKLKPLFLDDNGSLPDIYVEPLSNQELVNAYSWLRSISAVPTQATLWSKAEQREIPIKDVKEPAEKFVSGDVELFRHGLDNLEIDGILIPHLTIEVYTNQLSFDYRPGEDWGPEQLNALFKLLKKIKEISPDSRVFQADEGCYDKPNEQFELVFNKWLQDAS